MFLLRYGCTSLQPSMCPDNPHGLTLVQVHVTKGLSIAYPHKVAFVRLLSPLQSPLELRKQCKHWNESSCVTVLKMCKQLGSKQQEIK